MISSWVKHHHERALSQGCFRTKTSTTNHLVTLTAHIEESQPKGKAMHCWFEDFKKGLIMYQGVSLKKNNTY